MQNRTSRNAFTKTLRSKPDDPSYRIAPRSQIASQSDSETQHVSGLATPWGHRVNPFKCGSVGRTPYRLVKWSLEIPWFPPLAGASPSCPVPVLPGHRPARFTIRTASALLPAGAKSVEKGRAMLHRRIRYEFSRNPSVKPCQWRRETSHWRSQSPARFGLTPNRNREAPATWLTGGSLAVRLQSAANP